MPQFSSNIVINDGQTTPVAQTFKPASTEGDWKRYANLTPNGGIGVGGWELWACLLEPKGTGQVYRLKWRITRPTLEVTAPTTTTGYQPAPRVAYTCVSYGEFLIPSRSTTAERSDLIALTKNFMALAMVTTMVKELEDLY